MNGREIAIGSKEYNALVKKIEERDARDRSRPLHQRVSDAILIIAGETENGAVDLEAVAERIGASLADVQMALSEHAQRVSEDSSMMRVDIP